MLQCVTGWHCFRFDPDSGPVALRRHQKLTEFFIRQTLAQVTTILARETYFFSTHDCRLYFALSTFAMTALLPSDMQWTSCCSGPNEKPRRQCVRTNPQVLGSNFFSTKKQNINEAKHVYLKVLPYLYPYLISTDPYYSKVIKVISRCLLIVRNSDAFDAF